jgi:hypothetical protein
MGNGNLRDADMSPSNRQFLPLASPSRFRKHFEPHAKTMGIEFRNRQIVFSALPSFTDILSESFSALPNSPRHGPGCTRAENVSPLSPAIHGSEKFL